MATINPLGGPINYMGLTPQVDIAQSFTQGLQAGSGFRDVELREKAVLQKEADRQTALQMQQQYASDVQSAFASPDYETQFAKLSAMYPAQREALKQAFGGLDVSVRENEYRAGTQALLAVENGKPEIATDIINQAITAAKNSGRPTARLEQQLSTINEDPVKFQRDLTFVLSNLDPEKFSKVRGEQRLEDLSGPALEKARADAKTASVNSKFAESYAVIDLERKGYDIQKIQEDIKINRLNSQIALMNVGISRETNTLKQQELIDKRDERIENRETAIRTKIATAESERADIDNFLNTATRALKTDKATVRAATGPIQSRLFTTNQGVADYEGLIETLSSQAFLAQIPKIRGTGALSNTEGDKLQAALTNLSLRQSPERLEENLKEAVRLLTKARANITLKSGLPETNPDVPAANAPAANAPAANAPLTPAEKAELKALREKQKAGK